MMDTLGMKEKEVIYLKRALESVYSRFSRKEESREAELDAQVIATRAIDGLAEKDTEILALKAEIDELKKIKRKERRHILLRSS